MKEIVVRLSLLGLIYFTSNSMAFACFFGGGYTPPIKYLNGTSSFFVAELLNVKILTDENGSKYAKLDVNVVDHIYGEILPLETTVYLRENEYKTMDSYSVSEKYIIVTVNGTHADKNRIHRFSSSYLFSVVKPETQWVVQRPCRLPFLIVYSEDTLSRYKKRLYQYIERSERIRKDGI